MQKIISLRDGVARLEQWRMRQPVSFELLKNEQIAIIGKNGSGKSMLIDMLIGKHPLQSGTLKYDFTPSQKQYAMENIKYIQFRDTYGGDNDKTFYLQQRWNQTEIDPSTATVKEHIEKAFSSTGDDTDERLDFKKRVCHTFGLDDMMDKYVILLSSGELRKLSIAASIFSMPRLIIIDNPYIGLDKDARLQLTELLNSLATSHDIQIILVVDRNCDIPEFATHVVEVEDMVVGKKQTRIEYFSTHNIARPYTLDESISKNIVNLPYKTDAYDTEHVVEMHDVDIRYGNRTILSCFNWTIKSGERWILTGTNGSGKSTLLSLICADNPQSYACDITLFDRKRGSGESIWDIKKHIGYVSPELHRAFHTNVSTEKVVASGFLNSIGMYTQPTKQALEASLFWMNAFGIETLGKRSFLTLSSGEQRLALLARAMVKDPELLILDEPLHGLDEDNRERVKQIVETFCKRREKTLIMVTHYEEDIPTCIDRRMTLCKN